MPARKPTPPTQAQLDAERDANLRALGIDPERARPLDDLVFDAAVALCRETKALTNERAIAERIGRARGSVQNSIGRLIQAGRMGKRTGPSGRSDGLYPVVLDR